MEDKILKNIVGFTPLAIATSEDKDPRNVHGATPLHNAAYHGHLQICQNTIKNMEDKNPKNNSRTIPLHDTSVVKLKPSEACFSFLHLCPD